MAMIQIKGRLGTREKLILAYATQDVSGKKRWIIPILLIILTVSFLSVYHNNALTTSTTTEGVKIIKVLNVTAFSESGGDPNQAYYVYLSVNGTLSPSNVLLKTSSGGVFPPSSFPGSNYTVGEVRGDGVLPFVIPSGEVPTCLQVKFQNRTIPMELPHPSSSVSVVKLTILFDEKMYNFTVVGSGEKVLTLNLTSPIPLNVSGNVQGEANVSVPETLVFGNTAVPVYLHSEQGHYADITLTLNVSDGVVMEAFPVRNYEGLSIFNVTVKDISTAKAYVNSSSFYDGVYSVPFKVDGLRSVTLSPGESEWGLISFPGNATRLYYITEGFPFPVPVGEPTSSLSSFTVKVLPSPATTNQTSVGLTGFQGEEFNFTVFLYNPTNVPLSLENVSFPLSLHYIHALLLPDSGENVTFQGVFPDYVLYQEINMTFTFLKV
ncbi:hypothetical protein IC007_0452 [Sulfuracidifex tepidarius]|uniref:Uncharacterized protein n=1 Tax=Sulfuracidifex tepidarius TaxID=1294262 RepID=A0A510E0I0_9CREN|nr:hypothetical protein IC007_0452 [Sulfuracidifex tepidarius]